MEKLPEAEIARIQGLLSDDERKRDRKEFEYTFDILKKAWAFPYSIWAIPNSDALRIINREVDYDNLFFENLNEVEKGMHFEDQRQFTARYISRVPEAEMLCEARDYEPCLQGKCPIFRAKGSEVGGKYGICPEYKIAFKR